MKPKKILAYTKLSEIEKRYGVTFGEKDPIEVADFLRKKGYPSLAEMLEIK